MRSSKADEEQVDRQLLDEGGGSEVEERAGREDSDSEVPRKKKRKREEKRPRSKDWDDKSIRTLISEYGVHFAKSEEISERSTEENRKIWKEITRKLRKSGYSFSVKSAQKKWDDLESVYVDMASRNVHPGMKRMTCPYGRELTAILNPGGMRNYMQIEEEEQREQEKASKEQEHQAEEGMEDEGEEKTASMAMGCIVTNMTAGRRADRGESTSGNRRDSVISSESDSDVIILTDQSDDEHKAKSPSCEPLTSMKPNIVLQKSANYVEYAQSEPVNHPVHTIQPNPSTASEDMVLGIACQMYRHFAHHQHGNRTEEQPKEGQPDGMPMQEGQPHHSLNGGTSGASAVVHVSDDGGGMLAPLQIVIERLMIEKERKLALLEERNDIDRQRIALDQTRMRLIEQLISVVSTRRNT